MNQNYYTAYLLQPTEEAADAAYWRKAFSALLPKELVEQLHCEYDEEDDQILVMKQALPEGADKARRLKIAESAARAFFGALGAMEFS